MRRQVTYTENNFHAYFKGELVNNSNKRERSLFLTQQTYNILPKPVNKMHYLSAQTTEQNNHGRKSTDQVGTTFKFEILF
jgi:hypothetical protein